MPDKLLHGEGGEIRRRKRKSHAFLRSSEKQTGSAEQKGLRSVLQVIALVVGAGKDTCIVH